MKPIRLVAKGRKDNLNREPGSAALTSKKTDDTQVSAKLFPPDYISGQSEAATLLHRELEILSDTELPILLTGETGVGKEHLARLVHRWSKRTNGPFVAVNCAAIPAELLEAEMFGIGKGVATGVAEREGYFREAEQGTLFLDEIGEMSPPLQAKLLRALQAKEIRRVGGEVMKTNVRIVAATNSNIEARIKEGAFRADLYYRLAGAVLRVPALRERQEDISLFVQYYADLYAREANKTFKGITLWALELLTRYAWPGNVRELEHEVRRLVYLCPKNQLIESAMLPERIWSPRAVEFVECLPSSLLIEPHLAELERSLIRDALTRTNGNQTQAAKLLGITRNGLAIKMQRLSIRVGSRT
ncbi:MAG TPA: sigma-54 dependent transcriptional regulator [Pyrinomonadaceae bacterium]|nr:sigma-54 dependent transcriptional regulator [Pyrinomonadaceae bacterium]